MSLNFSGSGGSGGNNGGSPCGACKFLRRKCVQGCVFAPYFDAENGTTHFAAVHKVFGASNVSKLLLGLPTHRRLDAALTLCYEAQARLRDPVYGCISHIFALQKQVISLQAELSYLQNHLPSTELRQSPPLPPPQTTVAPIVFSFADLPSTTSENIPVTYDMSTLFDAIGQPSLAMHQQRPNIGSRQYVAAHASTSTASTSRLQGVSCDLSHRHHGSSSVPSSNSNASSSPSFTKYIRNDRSNMF